MSFPLILKQPKQVLHRGVFTPWADVVCLDCHDRATIPADPKRKDRGHPRFPDVDKLPLPKDYSTAEYHEGVCKCANDECDKNIVVWCDVAANKRFVDLVNALPLNERHPSGLSMDQTGGMTPGFSGPVGESGWISGCIMDDGIGFCVFFGPYDVDADWEKDADISEWFPESAMKKALAFMKKTYQGGAK